MTARPTLPANRTWWYWSLALGVPAVLVAVLAVVIAGDDGKPLRTDDPSTFQTIPEESPADDFFDEGDSGNEGEEVEPDGDLAVVDSGFSVYETGDDSEPAYSYAAIVDNPTDARAEFVTVRILLRDGEGTVLLTDSHVIQTFAPGMRMALASESPVQLDIDEIEVRFEVQSWREPTGDAFSLTVSEPETVTTEFDTLKTTVEVSSDADDDVTSIDLVAVYRNAQGRIVGGTPGFLEFLPAGDRAVATIESGSAIPGVASTEVFARGLIPSDSGFPRAGGSPVPAAGGARPAVDVDG